MNTRRRHRAAHVDLPGVCASLIARHGGELVYTSYTPRAQTMRVDASHWPPRVVVEERSTSDAARGRDGAWLFHRRTPHGAYELEKDGVVVAVPIECPDVAALFPRLNATNLGIERAHKYALSQVALVGTRAVLVPRHLGYGDRRRLLVERDGAYVEAPSLPEIVPEAVDEDDAADADAARARFRG